MITFSKLVLSIILMTFAFTVANVPDAYAGKKSHKSEKHSEKHSKKKSDKSKKSKHSDKSKKSKKSAKSKKSRKHNQPKVEICHISQGNGKINLISVSERSVNKHINKHGDALAGTYFEDLDGDGFGDTSAVNSCPIAGYVATGGDCAVDDALAFPGAAEVCGDNIDNNCDGVVDEFCQTEQLFVDVVGDCDGFGSQQPYSSNPPYFQLAIDEGTGQDGQPEGWCGKSTPFEWTHNLDELPADATITRLTLQVNAYGLDDATVSFDGSRDNKLYVDGVEVPGAFDFVSAPVSTVVEYIDLPISSADDGLINISIDPSGGDLLDCVFYDYSELVVEYTSQTAVDSPPAGFCQNGDQPSVPVTCPCGSAEEVLPYFVNDPQPYAYRSIPSLDRAEVGVAGSNTTRFFTDNRGGPTGTGCRLIVEPTSSEGFVVDVDPLNTAQVTACKDEIGQLAGQLGILE